MTKQENFNYYAYESDAIELFIRKRESEALGIVSGENGKEELDKAAVWSMIKKTIIMPAADAEASLRSTDHYFRMVYMVTCSLVRDEKDQVLKGVDVKIVFGAPSFLQAYLDNSPLYRLQIPLTSITVRGFMLMGKEDSVHLAPLKILKGPWTP